MINKNRFIERSDEYEGLHIKASKIRKSQGAYIKKTNRRGFRGYD